MIAIALVHCWVVVLHDCVCRHVHNCCDCEVISQMKADLLQSFSRILRKRVTTALGPTKIRESCEIQSWNNMNDIRFPEVWMDLALLERCEAIRGRPQGASPDFGSTTSWSIQSSWDLRWINMISSYFHLICHRLPGLLLYRNQPHGWKIPELNGGFMAVENYRWMVHFPLPCSITSGYT